MWTHTTCFAMMFVISVGHIEDHVLVCVINIRLVWMFVYTVWKRCERIAFIHSSKMMKSGRLWTRTTFLCIQCERVWFCVDMITLFKSTLPANSFVCMITYISFYLWKLHVNLHWANVVWLHYNIVIPSGRITMMYSSAGLIFVNIYVI